MKETLGGVVLPETLVENITRQIANIKPLPPVSSRPLMPWAISTATTLFLFLFMTAGSQYLARFQRAYNLDAQSETTIEIIDALVTLDTQAKPDLWNRRGWLAVPGKSRGVGRRISDTVMPTDSQRGTAARPAAEQQWIQASGPESSAISGLFLSTAGDVYAASPTASID